MEFADTFLATTAGAIVGAVVGALASWGFALDLRRRSRAEAIRSRGDDAVAEVVARLGELAGAAAAFRFGIVSRSSQAQSPHVPRQRLLSAISVALMATHEHAPLLAVERLVDTPAPDARGDEYERAGRILVDWRCEQLSADEAVEGIQALMSRARTDESGN